LAALFHVGIVGRLFVWDVAAGALVAEMQGPEALWSPEVAFTPDGTHLVVLDDTRAPAIWEIATGAPLEPFTWEGGEPSSHHPKLAISPDGAILLTVDDANGLRQWDMRARRLTAHLPLPFEGVADACLAFRSDSSRACVVSHQILLWDVRRREAIRTFGHRTDTFHSFACFSPEGRRLFILKQVGLEVWAVEQGRMSSRYAWRPGELSFGGLLPDGRFLTVGADERTIRLWPSAIFGKDDLHLL
jgi:WD40 repeat protein